MPAAQGPTVGAWTLLLATAAVLFSPGAAALRIFGLRARGPTAAGLALSLSMAFWPVLMLGYRTAGLVLTPRAVAGWTIGLTLLAIASWLLRPLLRPPSLPRATTCALTILLAVAVVLRALHARGLVVPPWVDGYHHSLIVQLMLEQGGLPRSWQPYLPVERFEYHFGFHSLAAAVAWLTDATAPQATLWLGQALNALLPLAMFPFLTRLSRHPTAAVVGAAIPVSLYYFPAYYAAWGRYTQLAGLCLLPTAWFLVAELVTPRTPESPDAAGRRSGLVPATALVTASLFLTHVRVFVFFAIGLPILVAFGLSCAGQRRQRLVALAATGLLAGIVVTPWLAGWLLPAVAERAASSSRWYEAPLTATHVPAWVFTIGLNRPLLGIAGLSLALGLIARRRAAWAIAAWLAMAVGIVEAHRFGLPATSFLSPFALAISAFVVVALAVAIGCDVLLEALATRRPTMAGTASHGLLVLAVLATLFGAARMREVVTSATILVQPADLVAATWLRQHTPTDACFLVTTAAWQLGTYRGLDGGYWLPLLARRSVTMPASFYHHGKRAYALAVDRLAGIVSLGDRLTDEEIMQAMRLAGARYVYVGPASQDKEAALTARRLEAMDELEPIYRQDGVTVFRLAASEGAGQGDATRQLCRPLE